MKLLLILLATTALVAWGVTGWVLRHAKRLRLVQIPNQRSSHERPTPVGGGLGIVVAGSFSGVFLVLFFGWTFGIWLLVLGAVLAAVGLRDDIAHLPAWMRLGVQVVVCVGLLMTLNDFSAPVLGAGINPTVAGWTVFGLFLIVALWWINLFNFMDGIDGIAGMQAIFMLLTGATFAVATRPEVFHEPVWIWMLCIAAATIGFLLLNWPPAKIFMGDVGSTWLAFVVLALMFLTVQEDWLSYAVWLILAAVFVTDATVTLLTRMVRGERWYEAHRNHVYQRLSRRWHRDRTAGHRSVIFLVTSINVLWLVPLAWACLQWPSWTPLFLMLAYLPLVLVALRFGAGRHERYLSDNLQLKD